MHDRGGGLSKSLSAENDNENIPQTVVQRHPAPEIARRCEAAQGTQAEFSDLVDLPHTYIFETPHSINMWHDALF